MVHDWLHKNSAFFKIMHKAVMHIDIFFWEKGKLSRYDDFKKLNSVLLCKYTFDCFVHRRYTLT